MDVVRALRGMEAGAVTFWETALLIVLAGALLLVLEWRIHRLERRVKSLEGER